MKAEKIIGKIILSPSASDPGEKVEFPIKYLEEETIVFEKDLKKEINFYWKFRNKPKDLVRIHPEFKQKMKDEFTETHYGILLEDDTKDLAYEYIHEAEDIFKDWLFSTIFEDLFYPTILEEEITK